MSERMCYSHCDLWRVVMSCVCVCGAYNIQVVLLCVAATFAVDAASVGGVPMRLRGGAPAKKALKPQTRAEWIKVCESMKVAKGTAPSISRRQSAASTSISRLADFLDSYSLYVCLYDCLPFTLHLSFPSRLDLGRAGDFITSALKAGALAVTKQAEMQDAKAKAQKKKK